MTGVNKSMNTMKVTAQNVNVSPTQKKKSRKSRRRNKKPGKISPVESNLLAEVSSGAMFHDSNDFNVLKGLKQSTCDLDSNERGWYFKYIDPAGSCETARAIGEFSKIPDGLLPFSVDGEIRVIKDLSVPGIDSSSVIDLTGKMWSLSIISYPMYRIAFIALANNLNKEVTPDVLKSFVQSLNNLENARSVIDADSWVPFSEEEGWYFRIVPLPPTYDSPDPVEGETRTVSSYRLSYKSFTVEHNAPTLVDQGYWIGAHYALDSADITQDVESVLGVDSWITVRNYNSAGTTTTVAIPNLPPAGPTGTSFYITITPAVSFDYMLPANYVWYTTTSHQVVFADTTDTITFSRNTGVSVSITSSRVGTTSIVIPLGSALLEQNSIVTSFDLGLQTEAGGASKVIELPAISTSQIAANNPKMSQFLMKESSGAYLVHRKMRNPVFTLTEALSFGPVQFTTPGYDKLLNHNDGSGIQDTIDKNFSTASASFRSIPYACAPIVKLYQGWEGATNVNTFVGQFAHSGLPKNESLLTLVDDLNTKTTGVYMAGDNFLGTISKMASSLLSSLLTHQATPGMIHGLVDVVLDKAVNVNTKRRPRIAKVVR